MWFCFFFVHPLLAYRLQKKHSRCTWGLKDQQRSSPSSHTFCWSHLRFSVFFFFFLEHNSVSFKTFFSKREKKQSVFLCNNNNKNYRSLSTKKRKKVSLRISVRWPAEVAGVSVKVRDVNTHWRRAWDAAAPRWPSSHGCTENTRQTSPVRLSAMLEVNPYSLSPADLALLFSSRR